MPTEARSKFDREACPKTRNQSSQQAVDEDEVVTTTSLDNPASTARQLNQYDPFIKTLLLTISSKEGYV